MYVGLLLLHYACVRAGQGDVGRVLQLYDLVSSSLLLSVDFLLPSFSFLLNELLRKSWHVTAHRMEDVANFMLMPTASKHWQLYHIAIDFIERLPEDFCDKHPSVYLASLAAAADVPREDSEKGTLTAALAQACVRFSSAQKSAVMGAWEAQLAKAASEAMMATKLRQAADKTAVEQKEKEEEQAVITQAISQAESIQQASKQQKAPARQHPGLSQAAPPAKRPKQTRKAAPRTRHEEQARASTDESSMEDEDDDEDDDNYSVHSED